MRAGRLRREVVIEHKATASPAQNTLGEPQFTWVELASVYAAVEPLRGRELFEASQRQASVDTRIVIRYRSDIDETMRVRDGADIYNIAAPPINTDSRNVELQLMCVKGAGDG